MQHIASRTTKHKCNVYTYIMFLIVFSFIGSGKFQCYQCFFLNNPDCDQKTPTINNLKDCENGEKYCKYYSFNY